MTITNLFDGLLVTYLINVNILLASPLLTAGLSYPTFTNSIGFKTVTTKLPMRLKQFVVI